MGRESGLLLFFRTWSGHAWAWLYPLGLFHNVQGSAWEQSAAWEYNQEHRHVLLDTVSRWLAIAVWALFCGTHAAHTMAWEWVSKPLLTLGAVLLSMSMVPLMGYLVLRHSETTTEGPKKGQSVG